MSKPPDSPRLDRITTRLGDAGTTQLGDGSLVPKDHPRVEALGAVDELNSALGLVLTYPDLPAPLPDLLHDVQHDLFDLGAELAVPGHRSLSPDAHRDLDAAMETLLAELPPLKEFLLPGGTPATAAAHLARTACRRAERRLVALAATEDIPSENLVYINRLSDVLFCAARVIQRASGQPEITWNPKRREAIDT